MPAHEVLALDFDGVVCDALVECALVTWLGVHPLDRSLSGAEHVDALPEEFVERFRTVRDYSRLLDHFVVAHAPESAAITSQAGFDRLFASLPADDVRRFTDRATEARTWFRTREPEFWLDLHRLYPGIAELLRRHSGSVVIVTAKDADSVDAILDHHGLRRTVAEVFGECGRKEEAVREIAARRGLAPERVTFIDDNLANAVRVAATGAHVRWAQWGYQTPEHRAEAERLSLRPLHLDDLHALVPAAA
ncbi:HAD family hydrolase [Streptomyces calidiresistens]|uniref:HAD family hydrolase n=1 Tax=Streptomyces calidiresistens TaxID=1485586 RepID=A0A7W3T665_9ACTN|nr:HAD family hydrolase [Streptomyces calidiresistens]MBB0231662.1 HAD family hydrolase [Streptomyces calidiresistens]